MSNQSQQKLSANSFQDRNWWRNECRDLFFFENMVCAKAWSEEFQDMGSIHRRMCQFITSPHQRKQLMAFRGSFKSTVILGFVCWDFVWSIVKGGSSSMTYNTATKENTWNFQEKVKHTLLENPLLQFIFPEIPKIEKQYDFCTKNKIQYKHAGIDFSSTDTTQTSRHTKKYINDDLETEENSGSEYQREEIKNKWRYQKAILTKISKKGIGIEIDSGTPYHVEGLNQMIRSNKSYDRLEIPCWIEKGNGVKEVTFPELYSVADFEEKKQDMGETIFSSQYLLRPLSDKDALCQEKWIQRWVVLPENRWRTMVVDPGGAEPASNDATGITIVDTDEIGNLHVIYAVEHWVTPNDLIDLIVDLKKNFQPDDIRIEKEKYSVTIADMFQHRFPRYNISFIEHKGRSKESRIWRLRQWLEKKRILLGQNMDGLEHQLLTYPHCSHDDLLDSLSYHLDFLRVPKHRDVPKWVPNIEKSFDQEFSEFMMKQRARKGEDVYDTLY